MSGNDYTIFYKSELPALGEWGVEFDLFVSAYNSSERVRSTFERVKAHRKIWLLHHEYSYQSSEYPAGGECFVAPDSDEGGFVRSFYETLVKGTLEIPAGRLCVDITGMMRPHVLFLVRFLERLGVKKFDAIYSEPMRYLKKEKTVFSEGEVVMVRQVIGYEGTVSADTSTDLLIIGSGYDDALIAEVAEDKDKAQKIQIFGLPSLRADMYQENVLRARIAADAIGESQFGGANRAFAPANDPFATATVLSEVVAKREAIAPITNLYISPLATKVQVLGFGLFYIGECLNRNASIIFPFSPRYARETSEGVSRVWRYTVEFPLL